MPVSVGEFRAHFKTPAAGEIERREIVLDQLVPPAADRANTLGDISQGLRYARIDSDQLPARPPAGLRQPPTRGALIRGQRRPGPNPRPHSEVFHLPRQARSGTKSRKRTTPSFRFA